MGPGTLVNAVPVCIPVRTPGKGKLKMSEPKEGTQVPWPFMEAWPSEGEPPQSIGPPCWSGMNMWAAGCPAGGEVGDIVCLGAAVCMSAVVVASVLVTSECSIDIAGTAPITCMPRSPPTMAKTTANHPILDRTDPTPGDVLVVRTVAVLPVNGGVMRSLCILRTQAGWFLCASEGVSGRRPG